MTILFLPLRLSANVGHFSSTSKDSLKVRRRTRGLVVRPAVHPQPKASAHPTPRFSPASSPLKERSSTGRPSTTSSELPLTSARRFNKYQSWVDTINQTEHGFDEFSKGYLSFGLQVRPNGDISYREWAPGAETAYLIGDFSECSSSPGRPIGS